MNIIEAMRQEARDIDKSSDATTLYYAEKCVGNLLEARKAAEGAFRRAGVYNLERVEERRDGDKFIWSYTP